MSNWKHHILYVHVYPTKHCVNLFKTHCVSLSMTPLKLAFSWLVFKSSASNFFISEIFWRQKSQFYLCFLLIKILWQILLTLWLKHLLYISRFSDLLALADDIEADFKSVRVLRGVPARKAANASAAMGLDNRNSRKTTKKVVQETSGSSDSSDVSITIIIRVLPNLLVSSLGKLITWILYRPLWTIDLDVVQGYEMQLNLHV